MVIIRDERKEALKNRAERIKKFGGLRHQEKKGEFGESPSELARKAAADRAKAQEETSGGMSVASPEDFPEGGQSFAAINDLRGGITRAPIEDIRQQTFATVDDFPRVRTRAASPEVVREVANPGFQGTLTITEQPRRTSEVDTGGRLELSDTPAKSPGITGFFRRSAERGERLQAPVQAIGSGFGLAAAELGSSFLSSGKSFAKDFFNVKDPFARIKTVGGNVKNIGSSIIGIPETVISTGRGFVDSPLTSTGRVAFDVAVATKGVKLVGKGGGLLEQRIIAADRPSLFGTSPISRAGRVPAKVKKGSLLGEKESLSSVFPSSEFKTPKQTPFGFKAERKALLQREKSFLRETKAAPRTDVLDIGRGSGNRIVDLTRPVKSSGDNFLSQKALGQAKKAREVQAKELFKASDALSQIGKVRSTGRSAKSFGESFQNIGKFERKKVITRLKNKVTKPSGNQVALLKPPKPGSLSVGKAQPIIQTKIKPPPEGLGQGSSIYARTTRNINRVRRGDTEFIYGDLENVGVDSTVKGVPGFRPGQREKLFGRLEGLKAERLVSRVDERLTLMEKSRLEVKQARINAFKTDTTKVGLRMGVGLDNALKVDSSLLTGLGVGSSTSTGISTSTAVSVNQRTRTRTDQRLLQDQAQVKEFVSPTRLSTTTFTGGGGGSGRVVPPTPQPPPTIRGTTKRTPPGFRTPSKPPKPPKTPLFKLDPLFKEPKKKKTRTGLELAQPSFIFTPTLIGQEFDVGITGGKVFSGVGRRRRK